MGGKNLEIDLMKTQPKSEKSITEDPLRGGKNLEINLMKTQPKNKKPRIKELSSDGNQGVSQVHHLERK